MRDFRDRITWTDADIPPADGPWMLEIVPFEFKGEGSFNSNQAVRVLKPGWFDGGLGI